MEFRLLGPLRVAEAGTPIPIGANKLRTLLAELLLHANTAVPADRLVEVMWQGRPPASALASLYNHVMRLRRTLGPDGADRVRAVAPGYLVRVAPGELDAHEFQRLCDIGRAHARRAQWAESATDLTAALELWSGEPLTDVPDLVADQHPEIHRLREARAQAEEARIDARLHLGQHDEVIGELRLLVAGQPFSEVFHGQLMLALYRANRQAEALAVFRDLRTTLVEELGVEPSATVRDLHRRILLADPALAAPAPVVTASGGLAGHRHQLPADTRVFTGRADELEQLIGYVEQEAGQSSAGTVVISAIDGMAGIGKSALAIHAAHRLRARFPDGQLFIDLHGHTTGLEPLTPAAALDWFLRSLGVPPQLIPQSLDERAARYRHQLADTRTLIVLDNAVSSAQIRPLLPGTGGCLVLVTSRRRLTGLDDAHTLSLDVLPEAEATALLHRLAGSGRIPAGHPAIGELIALCGQLPLAIGIVAARLRHHRVLRVEDVVAQLRDEPGRLTRLRDEDRNLAAVFASSYAALPLAEQRLFRLLGQVPGPDVDAYAAAHLLDSDLSTAEVLLDSLLDHHLLTQHTAGRYRCHDLVRLYARELGAAETEEPERLAASARLLAHYRHTARSADARLARHTRPGAPPAGRPTGPTPDLPDRAAALAWLRAERDNLLAAFEAATTPDQVVELAAALAEFLQHEGDWARAATIHRAACAAARECGDRRGEVNALRNLGDIQLMSGETAAAGDLLERALAGYEEFGDRGGEADTLSSLARLRSLTADFAAAVKLCRRALTIHAELGDRLGHAHALARLGGALHMIGDNTGAAEVREQALAIYQKLGDRQGEAEILYLSGRGRSVAGDLASAVSLFEAALVVFTDLGDRLSAANVRWDLGWALHTIGDCAAAGELLERALAMFRDLGGRTGEANTLWSLGRVRTTTGDYVTAAGLLERAVRVYQDSGNRHGVAIASRELGAVRLALGDFPAATALLDHALTVHRELGQRPSEGYALLILGRVHQATGDLPAAETLLTTALAIFRDVREPTGEAMVLNSIGALTHETTGPAEALAHYRQALDIAREVPSSLEQARALEGIARCTTDTVGPDAALADLQQAVELYQRIGAAETANAERYLAELKN